MVVPLTDTLVPLLPALPELPPLPLLPLVPELPDVPDDPLVPELPLDPELPETPFMPPGVSFRELLITVDGEAFPVYPVLVKVTEVVLPIALTEKYPAVSR